MPEEPTTLNSLRPEVTIAGWNAVSRATGFARVFVVTAVLGTTFLGNTYQQSNLLSTVLFELLAAGLLSVPLVPALVARSAGSERDRLLGSLWGLSLLVLGVLALALALLGRPIMHLLTAAAPPEVASRQVALGAFLLWLFAPQLVLYAAGALATSYLHAQGRFAAAAAAPVANNAAVIATMVLFLSIEGAGASLDVSTSGRVVLGVGTTLGVAAMAALPWLAARRTGLRLRPRGGWRESSVRAVAREGAWAGALLAAHQLLLVATLVLANRVAGGVVATQLAFVFFLLPHALLAHPLYTSVFPRLAIHAAVGGLSAFRAELARTARRMALLLVPAALGLVLLGEPLLRLMQVGGFTDAGVGLTGDALRGYAPGLVGYGIFMLLCRAFAALGETRVAGVVALFTAAAGVIAMMVTSSITSGAADIVALALSHSAAMTLAALVLGGALVRRFRHLSLDKRNASEIADSGGSRDDAVDQQDRA